VIEPIHHATPIAALTILNPALVLTVYQPSEALMSLSGKAMQKLAHLSG